MSWSELKTAVTSVDLSFEDINWIFGAVAKSNGDFHQHEDLKKRLLEGLDRITNEQGVTLTTIHEGESPGTPREPDP